MLIYPYFIRLIYVSPNGLLLTGMSKIIVWFINIYQKTPLKTHSSCVFLPTCSEYTKQAVFKYGVLGGLRCGFMRICRCHPWQKNHYDPLK